MQVSSAFKRRFARTKKWAQLLYLYPAWQVIRSILTGWQDIDFVSTKRGTFATLWNSLNSPRAAVVGSAIVLVIGVVLRVLDRRLKTEPEGSEKKLWYETPESELTERFRTADSVASSAGIAASVAESKVDSLAVRFEQKETGAAKPRPNIIMPDPPRHTSVTWDKNYVFHEDRVSPKSRRALVIDFRNELEWGKEIKSLGSVKSQLTYSYGKAGSFSQRINRGFWLDHDSTHTDFERGDTRTLLIGIIFPDLDGRDTLQVYDNKRESENGPIQPSTITFGGYDPLIIKVALFTQTRHRFHKECEFELDKKGHRRIIKPFA